jgi:hypothetical protein
MDCFFPEYQPVFLMCKETLEWMFDVILKKRELLIIFVLKIERKEVKKCLVKAN